MFVEFNNKGFCMLQVKNIVISGTNYWNPGDDFVRDGVIRILREIFPGHQLNFLFYNFNQDFFPQNKFSGIHNMAAANDLEQYKDFIDYIIIAGLSAGTEIKDLYSWIIKNRLTDRVFLIGAGYENNYAAEYIKQEPELTVFKHARIITGRTAKVPQIIKDLHLPYHHINCPAILSVPEVKEFQDNDKIKRIAFSIQLPHEMGISNHTCAREMYILSVQLITELFGKYEIEVIAHHKSEYFHFLNLFKQYNVNIPVIFSSYYQDYFSIYKRYALTITTRLHSSLFSNGFGIPGIILNNSDRHTHCLQGFPHSVWADSKESFYRYFEEVIRIDLKKTAADAALFKSRLLEQYKELLKPVFNYKSHSDLPIHFFTIVLNGEPFIHYHIEVFNQLNFKWHWHIIEGVADLVHDSAWVLQNGGAISDELHDNGLSSDGTSAYLDALKVSYPDNITIYRKEPGKIWNGKREMVSAPLQYINEECLLWQVDSDELWTKNQVETARQLFIDNPDKTAAYYYCSFFTGSRQVITTLDTYGNHTDYEWMRTWRFKPGDKWLSHEPPCLCREVDVNAWADVAKLNPFKHAETIKYNLVFQHYAYVTQKQLRFKEIYYGYSGAVENWNRLQEVNNYPVKLKEYFHWVNDETEVNTAASQNIKPLAVVNSRGNWVFNTKFNPKWNRILYIRTDSIGDAVLSLPILQHIKWFYPASEITVICQTHIEELYTLFGVNILTYNKYKLTSDELYRNNFMKQITDINPDAVLNPVYSRDPVNDFLALNNKAADKITFTGDMSNMPEQELIKNNELYTQTVYADPSLNELQKNYLFINNIGINAEYSDPVMQLSEFDDLYAKDLFNSLNLDPARTVALFPFSQESIKNYSLLQEAVNALDDFTFIILSGNENSEAAQLLCGRLNVRHYNLTGKTSIMQTAAVIKRCRALLGVDSAGAHIACAVGTPNVVITGGGHFGRFIPYSKLTTVVTNPLECFGCNWKCTRPSAECITGISPELIINALKNTLFDSNTKPCIAAEYE